MHFSSTSYLNTDRKRTRKKLTSVVFISLVSVYGVYVENNYAADRDCEIDRLFPLQSRYIVKQTDEEIKEEHQSVMGMCSCATSVETKQMFENCYCKDFLPLHFRTSLSNTDLHARLRSGYKL